MTDVEESATHASAQETREDFVSTRRTFAAPGGERVVGSVVTAHDKRRDEVAQRNAELFEQFIGRRKSVRLTVRDAYVYAEHTGQSVAWTTVRYWINHGRLVLATNHGKGTATYDVVRPEVA